MFDVNYDNYISLGIRQCQHHHRMVDYLLCNDGDRDYRFLMFDYQRKTIAMLDNVDINEILRDLSVEFTSTTVIEIIIKGVMFCYYPEDDPLWLRSIQQFLL